MRMQVLRSKCPIAGGLDILGDKWTLLVIRDLFRGKEKFGDFIASPEKIKTNILTDRLKWLETNEIIQKRPYQTKPTRYQYLLTEKGRHLQPVLKAIAIWGETYIDGTIKIFSQNKDMMTSEANREP